MATSDDEYHDSYASDNSLLIHNKTSPVVLDRNILTPSPAVGRPTVSVLSCAVVCILVTELCERLTFYGITGNLVLFVTEEHQLNWQASKASILAFVFQGTCFTLPVFAGWLADSVAGRFRVILVSGLIYLVGAALLPLASMVKKDATYFRSHFDDDSVWLRKSFKKALYIAGLVLVAFGTGGIKANVSPFGADQVARQGAKAIEAFFIWFYWFINLGAFIAFTLVVYVQQEVSYFLGYVIPAGSIILAMVIFYSGHSTYHVRQPTGSVLSTTVSIVKEALRPAQRGLTNTYVGHWLDRAKLNYGGSYTSWEVDDVKKVFRLIPIFATFILYWTVYGQMNTAMVYQGQHMDILLPHTSFSIPIASLSILDTIGVLVLIPVMDKLVYPLLAKCNMVPTQLQRVGIGLLISTASMACAGGIELYRTDECCTNVTRGNDSYIVSNITIFYQVPQYTLIGLSEVFTSVTGLELAYVEAPKSLQGLVMGVFLLTTGLGTYLGAAVVAIVNAASGSSSAADQWYPDEDHVNDGKLAYYFFLLAGLMACNFIVYVFVAMRFRRQRAAVESIYDTPDDNFDNDRRLSATRRA